MGLLIIDQLYVFNPHPQIIEKKLVIKNFFIPRYKINIDSIDLINIETYLTGEYEYAKYIVIRSNSKYYLTCRIKFFTHKSNLLLIKALLEINPSIELTNQLKSYIDNPYDKGGVLEQIYKRMKKF
jgi:hypothetical protein